MKHTSLFGILLRSSYGASGSREPIERYYASMFASYHNQFDSQPSCAAIKAIARGDRPASRRLLQHYWDTDQPRCPQKLAGDLAALTECCFADAACCNTLRDALEAFLEAIPAADAEDLRKILCREDLVHMWTCLTWYALCGDHRG